MKNLISQLKKLKEKYNIIGIKQSFEDEGAILSDVILMRRITELANAKMSVKIGGCEALSDIKACVTMGVNGMVAPMIETEFALQKYIESVYQIKNIDFYINIESKTAYNNLDNILNSPSSKLLSGIVIGRSDLTKSFGYGKDQVDSKFIQNIVRNILEKCKKYNITTLMGGNISPKSSNFIKKLFKDNLLEYIETRNIIIKLNKENIQNLTPVIKSSLLFESKWLKYKANYYNQIGKEYTDRSNLILNRL